MILLGDDIIIHIRGKENSFKKASDNATKTLHADCTLLWAAAAVKTHIYSKFETKVLFGLISSDSR